MQTNWKYTQRFMLYFSSTRKKKKDEKFSSQFYTDNYSCRYDIICLALISAFWWLLVTRNFTLSISPSLSKSFTVFQLSFTITVHKRPMDHIATMNVEHWKPLVFFFIFSEDIMNYLLIYDDLPRESQVYWPWLIYYDLLSPRLHWPSLVSVEIRNWYGEKHFFLM